jgi:myo-inositol-1(or 4)-monophosphatase
VSASETNPTHFLEVAVEAAREAGEILVAEHSRPQTISYKGDVDIVTETDKKSEAAIVARLRTHFSKHAIVAEEGGGGTADQNAAKSSRYCWYVDPLDGTTNFAHGYPCFAVSIALLEEGEPLVAAILNPILNELFTATRGEGSFLNQKRIHVSQIQTISKSLLATGFPSQKRSSNPNIHYYWEFTLRSHGVRRAGSAALDLCSVACGRFDAFWEFGLKSWDSAAGILIVREAGGIVTDFSGQPYHVGDRELIASNGLIHDEMRKIVADVAERAASKPL